MWINDKVLYTPEVITVTKGHPIAATVVAVGMDGQVEIRTEDGKHARVKSSLCRLPSSHK